MDEATQMEEWMSGRAFTRFLVFGVVVIAVILGVLGYQVEQRNEAIDEIQAAAQRIETAAISTEQVLRDIVNERSTPEAVAQAERVREALAEIRRLREINRLLCDLPDLREHPECPPS